MPLARISLTLSRHFSQLFIASGRSSGLHPLSSHSCSMYVLAGCPALARPYVGLHWNASLMSSSLLPQQCPACLVRLTWIVFVMGGRWPYTWCFVGCCRRRPGDYRVKLKESKKRDKYKDLARELKKKQWNIKVTMIPTVNDALGTVTQRLVKGLEDMEIKGQVETIQITAVVKKKKKENQPYWGFLTKTRRNRKEG